MALAFTVALAMASAIAAPALPARGAPRLAWPGGAPPECAPILGAAGAANVWERAKAPRELVRYCDLLAGGAAKLAGGDVAARAALALAREADDLLPGHAAPKVVEGRALAALGQPGAALAALGAGEARDPGALDDPPALLAWARSLARAGRSREAVEAYRRLLPRAAALPGAERAPASVEAGLVELADGPASLDDAIAALREGLRLGQGDAQAVAAYALILALDRRGDRDESRAMAADRARDDPRVVLDGDRAKALLAVAPAEGAAMAACALEPYDPADARDQWAEYLEAAPSGPWAERARARLQALDPARARGRAKGGAR